MQIRVFSRLHNPAVSSPLYFLKHGYAPEDFRSAKVGDLCGRGRFRKVDHRSLQLMQRNPEESEPMVPPGNWSGGDPAQWIIVGQTSERRFGPGFPRYNLLNCGAAGLSV